MLKIIYIPYESIASMRSAERVAKILPLVKAGYLVLIDGRLSSADEATLIRETMAAIDGGFNGVELGVLRNHDARGLVSRMKHRIARMLVGDTDGITVIGPAMIISEMRQHPENIELCFQKEYLSRILKRRATIG